MNQYLRLPVVLATCVAVSGCTSMRPVASGQASLHSGDVIQIQTTSGSKIDLQVTAVDQAGVFGTTPDNAQLHVPLAEVLRIERKEFDGVKTAGLVLVIVGVLAAAVNSLASGLTH